MLRRLPPADILVTNAFWLPVLALRFARKAGNIVVNVARFPKGQLWLYRGVARLSAVSTAVHDAIIEQDPKASPVTRVVPNPINTAAFVPPKVERSFDPPRTIVYTGRVHPEKGLHVLIEAFSRLHAKFPDLKLRIMGATAIEAGGGGEVYVQRLRSLAGDRPVELAPAIYDRTALAQALQQAHYYCYPSLAERGESFGVAPLEAMATGLVTVVSGLGCFRDFVEDGVSGFVFDHRGADPVGNLTAVMERIIADPGLAAEVGKRSCRYRRPIQHRRYCRTVSCRFPRGSVILADVKSAGTGFEKSR